MTAIIAVVASGLAGLASHLLVRISSGPTAIAILVTVIFLETLVLLASRYFPTNVGNLVRFNARDDFYFSRFVYLFISAFIMAVLIWFGIDDVARSTIVPEELGVPSETEPFNRVLVGAIAGAVLVVYRFGVYAYSGVLANKIWPDRPLSSRPVTTAPEDLDGR